MNRVCPLSGAHSKPDPNGDFGEFEGPNGTYRISGSLLDARRPWSDKLIAKALGVLDSKRSGENPPLLTSKDLN